MQDVVIIGAGLAQLTLAIALQQQGLNAQLFTQTPAEDANAQGWVLSPQALGVLAQYGVADALLQRGNRLTRLGAENPRGVQLSRLDLAAGSAQPAVAIHQAALQHTLRTKLLPGTLHDGEHYVEHRPAGERLQVQLDSGRVLATDLLVGGDHPCSALAPLVDPCQTAQPEKVHCWYGVSHRPLYRRLGHPTDSFFEAWGPGQRFGYVDLNSRETYWYAICGLTEYQPRQMAALFTGWHAPVAGLLESTASDAVGSTPLLKPPPLSTFHKDKVVLLNDATQPTSPDLSCGADVAVESAHDLALALVRPGPLRDRLRLYSLRRAQRMQHRSRVQLSVDQLAGLRHPLACALRNVTMRLLPTGIVRRALDVLPEPNAYVV